MVRLVLQQGLGLAGLGLVIAKTLAPVVPMRIDGLFELKQAGRRTARPHQIKVRIGTPVHFSSERQAEQIAAELQVRVEEL